MVRLVRPAAYITTILAFLAVGTVATNLLARMSPERCRPSLAAVETLHERLSDRCPYAGVCALYQGALAYPLVKGIKPTFFPGRWNVYPLEKVVRGDDFSPYFVTQSDSLFWLEVAEIPSDECVVLTVEGEKLAVRIHGVSKNWRFPRSSKTTVQSLLEECSDRFWAEKITKERKATRERKGDK